MKKGVIAFPLRLTLCLSIAACSSQQEGKGGFGEYDKETFLPVESGFEVASQQALRLD